MHHQRHPGGLLISQSPCQPLRGHSDDVALAAGRVGQTVPVQNIDSKRIVTARVCADGSVEPLLEENKK